MSNPFLGPSIAISNGLCNLAAFFEERGHPVAGGRVIRLRSAFDKGTCRVLGHRRIVYGLMRDICLDCLTIVDEHPNGRGRAASREEGERP